MARKHFDKSDGSFFEEILNRNNAKSPGRHLIRQPLILAAIQRGETLL